MAWLSNLVEWWQHWMPLVALVAFAVIFTCALARRTKWILPVWLLFLVATGLHTGWLLLLIFVDLTDFAAMGVMFLVMFSWPASVTFIALLFIRPRRKEKINAAS